MKSNPFHLLTAPEIEKRFGEKYFYRQRIYRKAKRGELASFTLRGKQCFLGSLVLKSFLEDLNVRLVEQFPEIEYAGVRVFYDTVNEKRIVVDGVLGGSVSIDTDEENEEDLLKKIRGVLEWAESQDGGEVVSVESSDSGVGAKKKKDRNNPLVNVLPEEIVWVKVDSSDTEDVEVKSLILISLPSIAQFIGVRPDIFSRWLSRTDFEEYVLSAHYKHLQGTQNSVPWKKGIIDGYTPLIPFELVPEIIVAFRQSGNTPKYQEKAELLYRLSKSTLEAVGLAISGGRDKAAQELAKVGKGLGLTAADQIIAIFKQYETREFQVRTTKQFGSKIKELKLDYGLTIGKLTLGITDRWPSQWKALGKSRKLPAKLTASGREVMRELSPGDSVGMTFGEKHFIKDPVMREAIETGRQGKDFYERLKQVGLLEEQQPKQIENSKHPGKKD